MAPNRLAKEKSPYLLQHKNNPVEWYPWGNEAFETAKRKNKPIFLSIGYSTCYWCHVMEKDSFEIEEVAEILNRHYISIKVDREERPDVDQIYMDAVVGLTGHGGWPMSMMLTPDLRPFWGGTYFPREQFKTILSRIAEAWEKDRDNIINSAKEITEALRARDLAPGGGALDEGVLREVYRQFSATFDPTYGGFGTAPKFPPSSQISLLLRIHRRSGDEKALSMALETLRAMAHGGIYDQLGFGFHRYATDTRWLIPHFEKMLYDNALLAFTYLEAFQVTGDTLFSSVARETLEYVLRDMTDPQGGFYSAEDAGEVGAEGEFYVWNWKELSSLLTDAELSKLKEVYSISESGNFEGNNILSLQSKYEWNIKQDPLVASAHEKLFRERNKRPRPHLDDKILTSWNGMMISAFAKASQVLGDGEFLEAASKAASFVKDNLFRDGKLLRRYRDGEAGIAGYQEDYAYLIEGLLHLYEASFDTKWLLWARELQDIQDELFWDGPKGGYFFTTAEELPIRKKEFIDGATPSGNSVSLLNLIRLYGYFGEAKYREKRNTLASLYAQTASKYPTAFSRTLQAFDYLFDKGVEIAVSKGSDRENYETILKTLRETFSPNKIIGGSPDSRVPLLSGRDAEGGKTTVYVCRGETCDLPTPSKNEVESSIKSYNPLKL